MWQPEWHVIKLKNNEEIICKDSTFFIGQTQKFIFISSPTDYPDYFETRTIKMEDIEDFRVYSAPHWRSIIP